MNVLVTGATGFIGGHLVERLVSDGHRVRILARPTSDLSLVGPLGVEVHVGDVTEYRGVREAADGCEVVFHAARVQILGSRSYARFRDVNVAGTENVVRAAQDAGARRLVHLSSISVHGRPRALPIDEKTTCLPVTVHGRTKLGAERVVSQLTREGRLSATVARLTAVMGPRSPGWLRLFRGILGGRWIVPSRLDPWFHVTDVDDVVQGLRLCAEGGDGPGTEIYVLGADRAHRLHEIAGMIAQAGGVELRSLRLPAAPFAWTAGLARAALAPLGIEPRLVHHVDFFARQRLVDSSKAKAALGFRPERSAREAVRRTLGWYRDRGVL